MRLSWVGVLVVLFVSSLAASGCRARKLPPVDEDDAAGATGAAETPAEATPPEDTQPKEEEPEEAAAAEEAAPKEEEPASPEREARLLYQTAMNLYNGSKDAWKSFRDGGEKKEDWEKSNDLLIQAQERCNEAIEKDPDFERIHDLLSQINSMRRTLMDVKPD